MTASPTSRTLKECRARIIVPGKPIGQPRPKAVSIGGSARVYNPAHPVDTWKASIRLAWGDMECLDGPVYVLGQLVFPRTQGQVWKRKPMPRLWHDKKPDLDNCIKAIKDALNGLAWRDDSQVCLVDVHKVIASGDESPRSIIEVGLMTREPRAPLDGDPTSHG